MAGYLSIDLPAFTDSGCRLLVSSVLSNRKVHHLLLALDPAGLTLKVGLEVTVPFGPPVLACRESDWSLGSGEASVSTRGDALWIEGQNHLLVVHQQAARHPLEQQTFDAYKSVISAAGADWKLCRIWNFIPGINQESQGLENYRSFCAGRANAFEALFGPACASQMPAASGVGCDTGRLAMIFLFCRFEPVHLENPHQVPAYQYPAEYGPRSPSFSRATICGDQAFISGTAAIEGHRSIGIGNLQAQLDLAIANIRRMLGALETKGFQADRARRHVVVYVRRPEDVAVIAAAVEAHLLREIDRVVYLKADICRQELLVEIEMTLN